MRRENWRSDEYERMTMLCLRAFSDGVSGSELRYLGSKWIPIDFLSFSERFFVYAVVQA